VADVGSARVEVTGDVRNFARQTERDLYGQLSRINTPEINVRADVDVDRNRLESTFLSAGTEAAREMTTGIGEGLSGLSGILSSNPYVAAAGVAMGVALAAALLPALGAALSGALIGGAGLGVIGLGAWLLREEPALKAAAGSLTGTLKSTFTDAAKPMLGPFVGALKTFEGLAKRIGPQVSEMFAGLADSGAIQALATGLAGLVEAALPGFQKLITAAGPFLTSLGQSLPVIGEALSQFFSSIASGGPGAAVFFEDLITFVAGAIIVLGQFLGWLSSVYPTVRQFFMDAVDWIKSAVDWFAQFGAAVGSALAPLVPAFQAAWGLISAVVRTAWSVIQGVVKVGAALIQGVIKIASSAISGNWVATWNAIKSTVSSVMNAVRSLVSSAISGVRSIIGSGISYIRSAWSTGWNALSSVVSSATGRVRSVVSGLISTIRGMFSAAGSWLRGVGGKIIDGLISGIRAGFDRVRSLLGSLTSMLPDWKGPAEVDRKILEDSGRMVIAGFGRGMESEFEAVRKRLAGLTAELPGFTAAAGTSRGGDGAALGGTVAVTIQAGAIVVQGQGREAGQEAAEAILERLGQATLAR
jgi:hypothetical protein